MEKTRKISINLGIEHLVFIAVFAVILLMTSYVIAIGSDDFSVHGHDYSEIEIKMETGSVQDDYSNPAWNLDEGTGSRAFTIPVTFSKNFSSPPAVIISLKTFDISSSAGIRASVRANDITATGFNAVFSTWSGSVVYYLAADWMAYGQ